MPKLLMTRAEAELEYDRLFLAGQAVLDRHNPCKWKDGRCVMGDGCCHGCDHLGPNGCTVDSLTCKLWLCQAVIDRTDDGKAAHHELNPLLLEASKLTKNSRVPIIMRMSKAECFKGRH